MLDKVKEWMFEGEMDGFDSLAAEEIGNEWDNDPQLGFDYMSLLKGAGGMMSGAGGMFGGGGAGGTPAASDAEKLRLQAAQLQAESSARTWKIVGGIAIAVLALGGIALVARPAAAKVA